MKVFLIIVSLMLTQTMALAGPIESGIAYQGRITQTNGTPLQNQNVVFRLSVLSPGPETCVLYDEQQIIDMSGSNGNFSLNLGKGNTSFSGSLNPLTNPTFGSIFDNSVPKTSLSCASGNSYTPTANDIRKLRVSFNDGSSLTTLADATVNAAPYAEYANKLQGLTKDKFIQTTSFGTQSAFESVFGSNGMVSELIALITGNSNQYLKSSGTTTFSQPPVSATTPTTANQLTNKAYVDSKVSSMVSGINQLTGDISASGTGSVAASINDGAVTDAKIAAVSASKLTGQISISNLPVGQTSNTVAAGVHGHNATDITAGIIPMNRGGTGVDSFSGTAKLVMTDAVTGTTLTSASCQIGKFLSFDAIGSILCADAPVSNSGTVTSITAGNGLTGGSISSSGTLAIDFTKVAASNDPRFAPVPSAGNSQKYVRVSADGTSYEIRSTSEVIADLNLASQFEPAGAASSAQLAAQTSSLQKSQNLNDLTNKPLARSNLGLAPVASTGSYASLTARPTLGTSSTLNVGTSAGTVAAGDDSRFSNAVQKSANLNDLSDIVAAKSNLNLAAVATSGSYLDLSNRAHSHAATDITSGTLPISRGGTGSSTISGTSKLITTDSITGTSLISTSCTIGQLLSFDASGSVVCANPSTLQNVGTAGTYYKVTTDAQGRVSSGASTLDTSDVSTGTLPVIRGGTGQSNFADGQLLIGSTTGSTLSKAYLTAGPGISITNGSGAITISASGSSGVVTSVSATAPLSVSGTTTPVISIAAGTAAGQTLRYDGANWIKTKLLYTDLLNSTSQYPFPSTSCNAGQAVTYSYATDSFTCTTLSIPTSQLTGTLTAAQMPALTGDVTSSAGSNVLTLGTVSLAKGGTNNAALASTAGGVMYMDGSKVMTTSAGTAGQVLKSNGASAPTWADSTASSLNLLYLRYTNVAAQSVGSIITTVNYTTADPTFPDTNTQYNATTGVFKPLVAGKYRIRAKIYANANITLFISKLSTNYSQTLDFATGSRVLQVEDILSMTTSDTAEIKVSMPSGSTTLTPSASSNTLTIEQLP